MTATMSTAAEMIQTLTEFGKQDKDATVEATTTVGSETFRVCHIHGTGFSILGGRSILTKVDAFYKRGSDMQRFIERNANLRDAAWSL